MRGGGGGGGGESTQKCHQVLKLCESKKIKLECVCVGGGGGASHEWKTGSENYRFS